MGVGPLGVCNRAGMTVVVGARGDRHVPFAKRAADRLVPEAVLEVFDVGDDYLSRRSSSAAAKNADAVRKISFARRSSAFSRLKVCSSTATSFDTPGRRPVSTSICSIQPRIVSG